MCSDFTDFINAHGLLVTEINWGQIGHFLIRRESNVIYARVFRGTDRCLVVARSGR
jgi:hypothetical protein